MQVTGTFNGAAQNSALISLTQVEPTSASLTASQSGTAILMLTGVFSGTIQLMASVDGVTFAPCSTDGSGTPNSLTQPVALFFDVPVLGLTFRLTTTAWGSGTVTYTVLWSPAPGVAVHMPRSLYPA